MNYKVTIDDRTYEVEIRDLHARPVIVVVDGVEIEVTPQDGRPATAPVARPAQTAVKPAAAPVAAAPRPAAKPAAPAANGSASNAVTAPIPGTIVAISVQPGQAVTVGQEVCVLEAMKMKNSIRAGRSGHVGTIYARVGQTVKHHETIMDLTD